MARTNMEILDEALLAHVVHPEGGDGGGDGTGWSPAYTNLTSDPPADPQFFEVWIPTDQPTMRVWTGEAWVGALASVSETGELYASVALNGAERSITLTVGPSAGDFWTFDGEKLYLPSGVVLISGDEDPSTGDGVSVPEGSLYLRTGQEVPTGGLYRKTGGLDNDWTPVGGGGATFTSSVADGLPPSPEIGNTWAPPEFAPLIATYGSTGWVGGLASIVDVEGVGVARVALTTNPTGLFAAFNGDDNLPIQMVALDGDGFHLGDAGHGIIAINDHSPLDIDPVPSPPAGSLWWQIGDDGATTPWVMRGDPDNDWISYKMISTAEYDDIISRLNALEA